ncbi:MAG: hypothetical protein ACLGIV_00030 [Actinomycetes bacterium]
MALAALAALATGIGGCMPSPSAERPEPTVAVTDAFPVVQRQVAALPGVVDVDLTYTTGLSVGDGFDGSIEVEPTADLVAVLDDVHATLWTFEAFEPDTIDVHAEVDGVVVATAKDLGSEFESMGMVQLRERYGPWPGVGPTRARA